MTEKVLLIVVDGMRPDGVCKCDDGRFEQFFKSGSYSLKAHTIYPPVTLPAHMSLFHSVDPDRHGIYNNTFVQQNHPINGLVEVLTAAQKKSAFFYTWEQLRDLCTPGKHLEFSWFKAQHKTINFPQIEQQATAQAIDYINSSQPDFAFLYLGGTDEFGHQYGWMSDEYLKELNDASQCIYEIASKIPSEYAIIVTADHGGHNRNHGDNVPEDMTIPMTFQGAMFEKGKELNDVSIKDIAPTIAAILGVAPDDDWEGQSVFKKA